MLALLLAAALLQAGSVAFENEYVRVTRNASPCADAQGPECGDRVLVSLNETRFLVKGTMTTLERGEIAVFAAGTPHNPAAGNFYEVAFKRTLPALQAPHGATPRDRIKVLHDGPRIVAFEETLEPGATWSRHPHGPRVAIALSGTRLLFLPEGGAEETRDQVPDGVAFNPPVVHGVRNVGREAMRTIVIELKARN
jgi:quercetin dioxygenase-like cupin family protein